MPSPFPGMDPYLESPDLWPDVHARLIAVIGGQLTPKLRPRYVARVELRTFMYDPLNPAGELYVIPDARIVERDVRPAEAPDDPGSGGVATARLAVAEPIDVTALMTGSSARERFLEIRDAANRRVVTVIEIVSPWNKVVGSAGRRAFRQKRDEVGDSDASWLEIDLLRQGTPTWEVLGFPHTAYRAYADRTTADGRRQLAWPIPLRARLPVLPVPLAPGEPDVPLDLQAAVDAAYEAAGYDLDLDYGRPPVPPLAPDDAAWAHELLRRP